MAFELCKDCRRMHWATDECPAKKSTAARMDVPTSKAERESVVRVGPDVSATGNDSEALIPKSGATGSSSGSGAGTQALPVDTTSRVSEPPKAVPKDRHPPGYMASYMRQWRAKQKAAKMALTQSTSVNK
jgi:hypothetical protein